MKMSSSKPGLQSDDISSGRWECSPAFSNRHIVASCFALLLIPPVGLVPPSISSTSLCTMSVLDAGLLPPLRLTIYCSCPLCHFISSSIIKRISCPTASTLDLLALFFLLSGCFLRLLFPYSSKTFLQPYPSRHLYLPVAPTS